MDFVDVLLLFAFFRLKNVEVSLPASYDCCNRVLSINAGTLRRYLLDSLKPSKYLEIMLIHRGLMRFANFEGVSYRKTHFSCITIPADPTKEKSAARRTVANHSSPAPAHAPPLVLPSSIQGLQDAKFDKEGTYLF